MLTLRTLSLVPNSVCTVKPGTPLNIHAVELFHRREVGRRERVKSAEENVSILRFTNVPGPRPIHTSSHMSGHHTGITHHPTTMYGLRHSFSLFSPPPTR